MKAFRNLRTIGGFLLLVIAIGTAGYHYIEGWTWFDGFYMVVTTLTTIGYQEVHPLSHAGRVFNVFVILSGVSLLALGVGALSQALLEFELQSFFGRRRMEREISRLDSHYIICGLGRVGRSVARELSRKPAPFVILENNEAKRQRFASENWLVLPGDATQEQTLREARIERARGLIAATTTDATNLYIVLTARGMNPQLKIIARASEDTAEKHLLTAELMRWFHPTRLRASASRNLCCGLTWLAFSIRLLRILAWIWKLARFTLRLCRALQARPSRVRASARNAA
jgi:voltage-gated potassium channel